MGFNILAIDGGGIRGLIPAIVLAELERRAGAPAASLFGLLAGTSTGGILAAGLTVPDASGAPRYRAEDLVEFYSRHGPRIFRRSLAWRLRSAWGLVEEKYDAAVLEGVLRQYLGDVRVSRAVAPLLLTAYDLERRTPYLVKSWRAGLQTDRDILMREAARATSAAPSYVEPALVEPPHGGARRSLIDGGVYATNPASCAYAEAARMAPGEPVRLVSLGTGRLIRPIRHQQAAGWGSAQWMRPVLDVVFDGASESVDYQLRQLLGGERYHRLQVTLTRASDDLDDAGARNLALLAEQARELIASRSQDLDRLLERLTG